MNANYTLALRTVGTVLPVMARVLSAPALKDLPVQVQFQPKSDDPRQAFLTQYAGDIAPTLTLPRAFAGVNLEADDRLYLGYVARELGYLPELAEYQTVWNATPDPAQRLVLAALYAMRVELALHADPVVNAWVTRTRELAKTLLPENPQTFWDVLGWVRYGVPPRPYNVAVPSTAYGRVADFWETVAAALQTYLSWSVGGLAETVANLLGSARAQRIVIGEPPNWAWELFRPSGLTGDWENSASWPEGAVLVYDHEVLDIPPDATALAEGLRLAQQLRSWWTTAPTRNVAAGVGKYNARLEESGLPPFTMPVTPQTAPPPRLALFLDISGSMWQGRKGLLPLRCARQAAIAIGHAVKAAGGELRVWAFCGNAHYLGHDLATIAGIRGGDTNIAFLDAVAPQLPPADWHYLFITDALLSYIPSVWDARYQAKSAVIYIPSGEAADADTLARLGDPVITISDITDLPQQTALAVRKAFPNAARL